MNVRCLSRLLSVIVDGCFGSWWCSVVVFRFVVFYLIVVCRKLRKFSRVAVLFVVKGGLGRFWLL